MAMQERFTDVYSCIDELEGGKVIIGAVNISVVLTVKMK